MWLVSRAKNSARHGLDQDAQRDDPDEGGDRLDHAAGLGCPTAFDSVRDMALLQIGFLTPPYSPWLAEARRRSVGRQLPILRMLLARGAEPPEDLYRTLAIPFANLWPNWAPEGAAVPPTWWSAPEKFVVLWPERRPVEAELGVDSHGLRGVGKANEVGAGERRADLLHLAAGDQVAEVDGEEACVLEERAHLRLCTHVVP